MGSALAGRNAENRREEGVRQTAENRREEDAASDAASEDAAPILGSEKRREAFKGDVEAHPQCPVRSGMSVKDPKNWRHGSAPDYTLTNRKFLSQKTCSHLEGSLERIVQNLVKSWEMELSHKLDPTEFTTISEPQTAFNLTSNGGEPASLDECIQTGSYNSLLKNFQDKAAYDTSISNEASHGVFKKLFKTGFAWEVVKVYAGPPKVAFSWRHWGHIGSETLDQEMQGKGKMILIEGFCVAVVDDKLKLKDIQVWFDSKKFFDDIKAAGASALVPSTIEE